MNKIEVKIKLMSKFLINLCIFVHFVTFNLEHKCLCIANAQCTYLHVHAGPKPLLFLIRETHTPVRQSVCAGSPGPMLLVFAIITKVIRNVLSQKNII